MLSPKLTTGTSDPRFPKDEYPQIWRCVLTAPFLFNDRKYIDRCEILQYNIIERLNFDDLNVKSSVPKPILL